MSYNNTVAIVSNRDFVVQEIKNMLVLLRDIDKVKCYDYYDADENIENDSPSVIILHSAENDKQSLKLLKKIRKNNDAKDIPIIIYCEHSNPDQIIESFDAGAADIILPPLKDYELVIRVIWAIRRNESARIKNTKDEFLSNLGIIDKKTGFYAQKYTLNYLEAVISKTKETKQQACLVLIKSDGNIQTDDLTDALKESVRINDTIAIKNSDSYYILLSKAKLNGVYSVFERLMKQLGADAPIKACVAEIQDELFEDVINVLDYSISNIPKNGEIAVIKKEDFIEMAKHEHLKTDIIETKEAEKDIPAKEPETEKDILEEIGFFDNREDTIDEAEIRQKMLELDARINREDIKQYDIQAEIAKKTIFDKKGNPVKFNLKNPEELKPVKKLKAMRKIKESQPVDFKQINLKGKNSHEEKEIDERNAIVYKQAYKNKLNMFVSSLFKKYANKFQNEFPNLISEIVTDPAISFFKLNRNDIRLDFEMLYDGIKKINFTLSIFALDTEIETENFEIEVMEFSYQKLDTILKTITDEYRNYLLEN